MAGTNWPGRNVLAQRPMPSRTPSRVSVVEGGGGLGVEDHGERVDGIFVGQLDRHELDAELAEHSDFSALFGRAVVPRSSQLATI